MAGYTSCLSYEDCWGSSNKMAAFGWISGGSIEARRKQTSSRHDCHAAWDAVSEISPTGGKSSKYTHALSNRHSLPDFWHWSHFGRFGWHLIFFSLQVTHAWANRFRGFPAFVIPQFALTGSPSMTFGQ